MKVSNIKSYALIVLAIFAAVSFSSCDKKDDDHDHDGTGHLHVYFNNEYSGTALSTAATYSGSNGRNFNFEQAQYYISNVRLVNHDGEEVPANTYLLAKTGESNEIEFEELAAGHYMKLRFDVGIDSTTNHTDPSTYPSTSVLASQSPSMHWSWASGYIFLRLQGLVDTSAAVSGTIDGPWEIHLGMDNFRTSVELDIDVTVDADSHPGVNVNFDLANLLTGIDLGGADISTHTMDNMPLANKVKANIASSFSVE